jgi:cyanophycinase-like exopeptidase
VTARGKVYLIGSSQGRTILDVMKRVSDDRGTSRYKVAVSYAALPKAKGFMQALTKAAFPLARVERFLVAGEDGAPPAAEAKAVVDSADVVFIGGGDPVLAAQRLVAAGAHEWVRAARDRGVTTIGISAGSMALAAFWASWPDDDQGNPTVVECMGVAPHVVVDCHAEEDDWEELRIVKGLLAGRQAELTFAGIGHGSALVVGARDELSWIGPSKIL